MPWQEMRVMDQRVRFASAVSSGLYTMTALCAAYGISRKTGYKWAERYRREGVDGLKNRSRAPHSCPHRTEERCSEALVAERTRHPRWGPRKLLEILKPQHPDWDWPAASTAGDLLKRHGLVEPRRRRRRPPRASKPAVESAGPNDLWTADYKGEFRMGNRRLCYPLTVADQHSRYLLACDGKTSVRRDGTRATFQRLFVEYGLPRRILTDGGLPFAGPRSPRRLSKLSVWWILLGIEPVVTQPGHPEQNGCHERMHRTLKDETARPPAASMRAQQRAFNAFRAEYNEIRPHESLGMRPPATLYTSSARPFPKKTPQIEYPGHWEIRRVSRSGEFAWRGKMLYVTATLAGLDIGLHETDDAIWSLAFGTLLIGRYDERTKKLSLL